MFKAVRSVSSIAKERKEKGRNSSKLKVVYVHSQKFLK
jgi:hypothetical protein